MFQSGQLLSREGALKVLWVAAFSSDRGLKKRQIQGLDLDAGLSTILAAAFSDELDAVALRRSGQLLFGATRIYGRRVEYLLQDAVHQQTSLLHTLAASTADDVDATAHLHSPTAAAAGGAAAAPKKLLPRGKQQAPLGTITVGGLQLRAAPENESDQWLLEGLEQLQEGQDLAAAGGGGGQGARGLASTSAWHLGELLRRDSSKDLHLAHPGDAGDLFPLEPTPLDQGDALFFEDPLLGDLDMFDIPEEEALQGGLLAPLASGWVTPGDTTAGDAGDAAGRDWAPEGVEQEGEGRGEGEVGPDDGGGAAAATPRAAAGGGVDGTTDAFTTPAAGEAGAAGAAGEEEEQGLESPGAKQRQGAGRLEGDDSQGLPKRRLFDQQGVDLDQQQEDFGQQQETGDVDMVDAEPLEQQAASPAAAGGHQVSPGDTGDTAAAAAAAGSAPVGRPRQRRRVGAGPAVVVDKAGQELDTRGILALLNNRAPLLRAPAAAGAGGPHRLRHGITSIGSISSKGLGRRSLLVAAVQQQLAAAGTGGGLLGVGDMVGELPSELLQLLPGAEAGAGTSGDTSGAAHLQAAGSGASQDLLSEEGQEELYGGQQQQVEGADMELDGIWRDEDQQLALEEEPMLEMLSDEEDQELLLEDEVAPGDGEYPRRHPGDSPLLFTSAESTEVDAMGGSAAGGGRALLERQRQLHRLLAAAAATAAGSDDMGEPGEAPPAAAGAGGRQLVPCGVSVTDLILGASSLLPPPPPAAAGARGGGSTSRWASMQGKPSRAPSSKPAGMNHSMLADAAALYSSTGAGQRLQVSRAFYDLLCLQSAGKVVMQQQVEEVVAPAAGGSRHVVAAGAEGRQYGVVVALVAAA